MAYYSYDHKRSDDISRDGWKVARRLRKSRKPVFLLICVLAGVIYLHISHTYTSNTESVTRQHQVIGQQDLRNAHKALHVRHPLDRASQQRQDDYIAPEGLPDMQDSVDSGHGMRNLERENNILDTEAETMHETDDGHKEDISKVGTVAANENFKAENADGSKEHRARRSPKLDEDDQSDDAPSWKMGPVKVEAELDERHEKVAVLSAPDQAAKQKVIEAESEEHLTLEETAESLPEIVHITFEEAVKDYVLEGWEDHWISKGTFESKKWSLTEPKIDFVYLWVNGSEEAFQRTKRPFEENSVLNDPEGKWISSHGVNRYRDWDELRYAIRSVERHAKPFRNQIQVIVNSVEGTEAGKQIPSWLNDKDSTQDVVKVIAQEEFMDRKAHICLPTFNSLTIENQLFNTPSTTDYMFALSDDMLLGRPHSASDIVSPLFGPVMGFKSNQYNTVNTPTEADSRRFGEKPFLIYTSWLLNRRFGVRKRKGQSHFGHALSRSIMREAIGSFPGPELVSVCKRFRGEPGFQLYSWFVTFHYLIERHREAMLWSLITLRSDPNGDGYMSWDERQKLMSALEAGIQNEGKASFRKRNFYHIRQHLERAGLEAPKVNNDFLWTSLDGPATLINLDCSEFEVNECLAPGFSISMSGQRGKNPSFSTAVIFERIARQKPQCGDCLLKLILNQVERGLDPVLPDPHTQVAERECVIKALMRYKYAIVEPNALFMMVTDAEQIDNTLTEKYVRNKKHMPGQLCLNDDVTTTDEHELDDIQTAMTEFYQGLFPEKSDFEK